MIKLNKPKLHIQSAQCYLNSKRSQYLKDKNQPYLYGFKVPKTVYPEFIHIMTFFVKCTDILRYLNV